MKTRSQLTVFLCLLSLGAPLHLSADEPRVCILPEQRKIQVRAPEQMCPANIPLSNKPATVADPQWDATPIQLSLSDLLNHSLQNLDVIRVLTGVNAVTTGRTIYDPAITNTAIDQARSQFDPTFNVNNSWSETNRPFAVPDPLDPTQAIIRKNSADLYNLNLGLSKRMLTGGVIDFGLLGAQNRVPLAGQPLNPQNTSNPALQFTQPLLQGAGLAANQAPIVIARIDTERSYFQFKSSVQDHVQSIIQGYWQLVQARTELWVREQQVQTLKFLLDRARDRLEVGDANLQDSSQALVSYENFRASLLLSQANVLQRESALRNVLGLSPYEGNRIIPTSPLTDQKMEINWDALLSLAELNRPDVIELKLILEADQQRLVLRNNQALPRLDGVALYRWNGLEGEMPNGNYINQGNEGFDDWTLGVNFSVPLGLRNGRATLRQQELIIERDRVNLQQGLHQASHLLANNVRNLDLFYEQYKRFQEVRKAAQVNLDRLIFDNNTNTNFIVLLQAITDWGNSISSEAQALVQYNSELAALERETGTILETHSIAFAEERFGSIGPLGRLADLQAYPRAIRPQDNVSNYSDGGQATENRFDLRSPFDEYEKERALEKTKKKEDEDAKKAAASDEDLTSRSKPQGMGLGKRLATAPARMLESVKRTLF
jgi:outer membrane protein TolC